MSSEVTTVRVEITRHQKVVETFDEGTPTEMENAAWKRLMRLQPMSTDWAVLHEGWDIIAVGSDGSRKRIDGLPKH